MSSENLAPPEPPARTDGPSRASLILLTAALAAMAGLVASFYPPRARLAPAPLLAPARGCIKRKLRFVPSDVTGVPFAAVNALPAQAKYQALLYLNMTSCGCGCGQSAAACLLRNPQCKAGSEMMKQTLARGGSMPAPIRRSN